MNKAVFIERLEYLLSDIPEEEREEAIAYYQDQCRLLIQTTDRIQCLVHDQFLI